jgi:hypothetical protein
MDDAIEICSGCGKMPRTIDLVEGRFVCTRCGNASTVHVKSDDYEKVATELDAKFHANVLKQKMESVASEPFETVKKSKKTRVISRPKKKTVKKKPVKKASKKRK